MRLWIALVSLQLAWALALAGGGGIVVPAHAQEATPATTVTDWIAQIEASPVQITDVGLEETETGLQVVLETADGTLATPTTSVSGDALILEILNAVLAGEAFEQFGPAEGIALVQVSELAGNRVQMMITGTDAVPTVEVNRDAARLTLSVVPGIAQVGEADESIQVVVTGEQDEGYNPLSASTATRTDTPLRDIPQSIQVVPRQVLDDRNLRTLNQALETVSSVSTGERFAGAPIESRLIRGFGQPQEGTFRNGLPDSDFFSLTPLETIERVEVLKGPASVLFGSFSPGGIVNVITRQPLDTSFFDVQFEVGNREFYQPSIDLSGPLTEDGALLYRFIANYQTSDNIQDFVDSNQTTIAPSFTLTLGEHTTLNFSYEYNEFFANPRVSDALLLSDDSLTPRSFYAGYPDLADLNAVTERFGLTLNHEFSDRWQIRANAAVNLGDFDDERSNPSGLEGDRFISFTAFDLEYTKDNYTGRIDVLGEFETGPVSHQVLLGFDVNRFIENYEADFSAAVPVLDTLDPDYDIPETEFVPFLEFRNPIQSYGVTIQDQIAFGDDFNLVIGGRYDWISSQFEIGEFGALGNTTDEPVRTSGAFSPRVGLVYQPSDIVSLYASFSRSFRQESLFNSSVQAFEPTRGTQYEVGVKTDFLDNRLSATLAAYRLTRTNVPTPDPANPIFSVATGEQRSQGIELDVTGEILPGWNIIGSYAYTDAIVTEDNVFEEGNQLANVPENKFSLWTVYEIQEGAWRGLGFGSGLFYEGDRQGDLNNSFQLDDYLRVDAALYYRRGRFNGALNFRNLFDVDYVRFASGRTAIQRDDPFTVVGSLSWEF